VAPRVRFAPSPTGYLHVGGARTALFNWLFARRHGGRFILRIEDTDRQRSTGESVEGILEGLRWLGLDWDEGPHVGGPAGPYFQSERFERHKAAAERLLASGLAYYCYCTPEEIQAKREAGERASGGWIYDRTCASLTAGEIAAREAQGAPRAVRFRVTAGPAAFDDLVHGPIEFDGAHIEDFVILRSDGHPTYNLSVVSDDVEMGITHVIRGDDHISNTPKQLLLYRALGAPVPAFAHVPLILGSDKKRLSKRHGATSVTEYKRQGYLPEAMINFLALLGWSPHKRGAGKSAGGGAGDEGARQAGQARSAEQAPEERELYSMRELAEIFDLDGISGGGAVFNGEKLDWMNQQYLMRLAPGELVERVRPGLEASGCWDERFAGDRRPWLEAVLELLKPRAKRLDEFAPLGRYFFTDQIEYEQGAVSKYLLVTGMDEHLRALRGAFDDLAVFDSASIEGALRQVADVRGVKAASLIHAVRVALTGRSASPGLFDVAALIGRERVRQRMDDAIRMIAIQGS